MTQKVRTRFAPSPTGSLHLGGARTALFNWLYARHNNGQFLLRIEDTDPERSKQEYTDEIIESLKWLGFDYDGEPLYQSKRSAIYKEKVEQLLKEGKAYRCYCTKEQLDIKRQAQMKAGKKAMYDRTCRNLEKADPSQPHVVRFKMPLSGFTSFVDTLRGGLEAANEELDDLIIRRTDGTVTYNFVVVVDDAEMGITNVIRGDDHIANTYKQVNLYKGFGYEPPVFTHVSMILGKDKKRLSKRHGAKSVLEYRDAGYLPGAMVNMLARLGWGHGDKEIFSQAELIELFTLDKITMSAAVFDTEKLDWLNSQHIKASAEAELVRHGLPFVQKRHPHATADGLVKLIPLIKERSRNLIEFAEHTDFYFVNAQKVEYDEKAAAKFLTHKSVEILEKSIELVEKSGELEPEKLMGDFKSLAGELSVKLKDVAQPLRVALTGRTVSPGVFEMIAVIGRDETVNRLTRAIGYIKSARPAPKDE